MNVRRTQQQLSLTSVPRGADRIYLHLFAKPITLPSGASGTAFAPPTDVYETDSQVIVRMEIAGADRSRMQVNFDQLSGHLRVRGHREDPAAGKQREYHQLEVVYGPFERILGILVAIDEEKIRADYRDGLLHVYLPKKPVVPLPELSVNIE